MVWRLLMKQIKDDPKNTSIRLTILYALFKLGSELSREQLAPVLLNNLNLSWIELQLYLNDLLADDLINDHDNLLSMRPKGLEVIKVYQNSVLEQTKNDIDQYIHENRDEILQEIVVSSSFEKIGKSYLVKLSLKETGKTLLDINIDAPSRTQADKICKKWKKSPQQIYASVIAILTD